MNTSPDDLFTWRASYELHIKEIDDQHRALLTTAAELHALLGTPEPPPKDVQRLIDSILAQKAEHFATEERRFAEYGYEDAPEHVMAHQGFSTHVEVLEKEYGHDLNLFAAKLIDFLAHWFVGHLNAVDAKYVPCFEAHMHA